MFLGASTKMSWRISSTSISSLNAPLIQPFRTALGDHNELENLKFSIKLDGGVTGHGEAAVASHITGESLAVTQRNLQFAGQWMKRKDVRDYLRISSALNERFGKNPAAIAAIETAILDALTRQTGIPLWKFFGPVCHVLQSDITIVIADLAETEVSVKKYYRQGFRAFKVKIGRDVDLDLKRVAAVRRLAPRGEIYLDANQGYTANTMLKFLKALQKMKIRPKLLEQPVPRDDYEGLKRVARLTDIPVCADESARCLTEAITLIKEKAVPVINIKLMKFGMIHAREIALLAAANGVKLMIGGMMESSIAMTASAHLAAGLGCFDYIDLDTPFFIKGDRERNPYLSSNGIYDLRRVNRGVGVA